MAKEKWKKVENEVDAEEFDSTKSQSNWPSGVTIDPGGPTGWKWGTIGSGGFEIDHLDYVVEKDGLTTRGIKSDFESNYEKKV